MIKNQDEIINKIEELKKETKCTDINVARAIGITSSCYSRIKTGQRQLSIHHLNRIASILETPFHSLGIDFNGEEIDISQGQIVEALQSAIKELKTTRSQIEEIFNFVASQ